MVEENAIVDPRPTLTDQEIFDRVWNHVTAQGKPGVDQVGSVYGKVATCVYLTEDGLRCGIGALLQRDERTNARARIMTGGVHTCWYWLKDSLDFVASKEQVDLLGALQTCHDRASENNFLPDFYEHMRRLARAYGFSCPATPEP